MSNKPRDKISFDPILNEKGRGYAALSIYPPGTFFDNTDWMVAVGGCGVGHRDSLREAKQLLLEEAKAYCMHRMDDAQCTLNHYGAELHGLETEGLRVKK